MGIEADRRRDVRLKVLRAYFQAMEEGREAGHEALSRACGVSVHAVGRVLRWAERKGLEVQSDPRRRLAGPAAREAATEALRSLDSRQSDSGCDGGQPPTDG